MRWVPFLLFLSLFSLSLNAQMVFQFTNKTKLVADPSISSKAPLRACFRKAPHKTSCNYACAPPFLILGVAKAGTSALFQFICAHHQVVCKKKELHSSTFFEMVPSCALKGKKISGFFWTPKNPGMFRNTTKFIITYRQPDDWVYSTYNFWCNRQIDGNCKAGEWTSKQHTRSPSHFDELLRTRCVNNGTQNCPFKFPHWESQFHSIVENVGRENLFVLSAENLYSFGGKTMTELYRFLKLDKFQGNPKVFQIAVNVNAKKGVNARSDHGQGLGKTIAPMLPSSRKLLREIIGYEGFKNRLENATGVQMGWN